MTAPHVTIIGSALSGNKGAAAMLESAIQTLEERVPGVGFSLLSMYPDEDRTQNTYPNLEIIPAKPAQLGVTINLLGLIYRILPPFRRLIARRSRAIGALVRSQVLLDQGGITFTDGREKFLLYNVASILPAFFVRTPVVKCAQAIGPFRNPVNRAASRVFLPKVRTIVTRGAITHRYAEEFGLRNLVAGADYAFTLELDGGERGRVAEHVDLDFFDGTATVVGVSPSVVLQKKVDARGGDYAGMITEFIDTLIADGHRVLLIPHSARTGTDATHNNDLPLTRRIAGAVSHPESLLFVDEELDSQDLRYLIGLCDFFVASRFHAMVSALAMSVPTLVIGWSHKYAEVLGMFGLEDWAIGHGDLDAAGLSQRFRELVAARPQVVALLKTHLPEVKAKALIQADLIAQLVREG